MNEGSDLEVALAAMSQSNHRSGPEQASSVEKPSPTVWGTCVYAEHIQILSATAAILSPQVLAALGVDTASLQSHNGTPLASKTASEGKHRMKSRVSEGSTDDNKSLRSESYNQHRTVRHSGLCLKDNPLLQLPCTIH